MEIDLDELFRRIADEPDGQTRIPLLHNAAMTALNRDPNRARGAAEEAVRLSEQCGDRWSLAMSHLLMGRALMNTARYAEALACSEQAYRLFEENGDRLNASHALSDRGSALISLNDYTKAFDMLSRSLALAEELGSDNALAYSLNRLGYLWQRLGSQSQALLYWKRCLVIVERMGSEELRSTVSNNIANIYVEVGERTKAFEYFQQNLVRAIARRDLFREAMAQVNIGEILQLESNFEEALRHQNRALEIYRTLGHRHFEGIVLSNMGRIFEKGGKMAEALRYQLDAVRVLEQGGDRQDVVRVKLRLAVLHRRMSEPQRGIEILISAMKAAVEIGSEQLQSKISKQLALSYEQQGNYTAAIAQYRSYMALRQSFLQANKQSSVERIRLRSNVEVLSREKEIQRIRNTELAGALEKVQALSAHYRSLNSQNTLLVESVTGKLRSPLARIGDTAARMHAGIRAGNRTVVAEGLRAIEYAARRASRTVDMLLLGHALEAGKYVAEPERIDIAGLVAKVLEDFREKAALQDVELHVHAGRPCIAVCDPTALKHVLNALVSNAVLYSPRGGRVLVEFASKGGTVAVRVTDHGPGLQRSNIRKLAATEDGAGSTRSFPPGSGLYLARAFAAALHGTLRYERRKKRTHFILEFPAVVYGHHSE